MYDINTIDDVTVLNLTGEMSHLEMNEIHNLIGKLMGSYQIKVVLNFQQVDHVNYKTLSLMLERAAKLRSLSGDLKCASLSHYMKNIFRFSGVDQAVESYDSVYDAIMSFNANQETYRTWH